MPNPNDWNDDELSYCRQLIARNGDPNVPRNQIPWYLSAQIKQATRDKRTDVVEALTKLQSQVQ